MADKDPFNGAVAEQLPTRLAMDLRIKLSIMMFLQYATWGAWWMVLNKYMAALDFTGANIGRAYATTAVASLFSPIIFGQIADRWVPTQYLLALLHLAGAGMLYLSTSFEQFGGFYFCLLSWALLYIPTISLSNSLSFHQIPDAARDFPGIRVFGTIGWIVAGLMVAVSSLTETSSQPIILGAAIGGILGLFCLLLPHTPPGGKSGEPLAFLRAFRLLKQGNFALFMAVSLMISIVLSGYYAFTASFLAAPPLNRAQATGWLTVGQFTEMLLLPLLPWLIKYLGFKRTLALGIAAWAVRYGIFALGQPFWFIVVAIAMHGICYNFFFVAAYIHTDNQAGKDIRASAQALFNLVTMGIGMLIGSELFGRLVDIYTQGEKSDWPVIWLYPFIGATCVLAVFLFFFHENKISPSAGTV